MSIRRVRILVAEDDALPLDSLVTSLARMGHVVDRAKTGKAANRVLAQAAHHLAILDVALRGMDGFEVLRRLRERGTATAVLMLTRDSVDDRVHGFDLGADDCITKPFAVREAEARVRALLRRTALSLPSDVAGRLTIDHAARAARFDGRQVDLTRGELALLDLLLSSPGCLLSKAQIADSLSTVEHQLSPTAIEVHVSRLRAKIGANGARIRTVRGMGYRWDDGDS